MTTVIDCMTHTDRQDHTGTGKAACTYRHMQGRMHIQDTLLVHYVCMQTSIPSASYKRLFIMLLRLAPHLCSAAVTRVWQCVRSSAYRRSECVAQHSSAYSVPCMHTVPESERACPSKSIFRQHSQNTAISVGVSMDASSMKSCTSSAMFVNNLTRVGGGSQVVV